MRLRLLDKKWLDSIFPTARVLVVRQSLEKLDFGRVKKVLVVGAGKDPYRKLFPSAEWYLAMDIAPVPGVTSCIGEACSLPVRNGSVDCVFASEVFEHLSEPVKFVKQVYASLTLGGVVVLTVPFMFQQHMDPGDYWRPTRMALEDLFVRFSNVQVMNQGTRLHAMSDLVTTAFSPFTVLYPLRIFNWLLMLPGMCGVGGRSTAPSGFLVVAKK